jgi:hypothetical protein
MSNEDNPPVRGMAAMLEFSDRPRAIRVHRRDSGDQTRTPIATISKATLAVVADDGVAVTTEEASEIAEVVELQREAEALWRRVWALRLPALLREAVDYCDGEASPTEVKMLARAVAEAHSRLRRMIGQ